MTRSQIEANLVRCGKTRAQARHEGGLYDPENDPADNGHDDFIPEADDGRYDDDPNVYHGNYSED